MSSQSLGSVSLLTAALLSAVISVDVQADAKSRLLAKGDEAWISNTFYT